jgi:hypothetical protein
MSETIKNILDGECGMQDCKSPGWCFPLLVPSPSAITMFVGPGSALG